MSDSSFEWLKVECHEESGEVFCVSPGDLIQRPFDSGFEIGEGWMTTAVDGAAFYELPEAFNQVQIG